MKEIAHCCAWCGEYVEESENVRASMGCYGTYFELWCPNCGAVASWYDQCRFPVDRRDWKIGKLARENLSHSGELLMESYSQKCTKSTESLVNMLNGAEERDRVSAIMTLKVLFCEECGISLKYNRHHNCKEEVKKEVE